MPGFIAGCFDNIPSIYAYRVYSCLKIHTSMQKVLSSERGGHFVHLLADVMTKLKSGVAADSV